MTKSIPSRDRLIGYVEGYYWKLLTWEQRSLIAGQLGRLGGGHYLYAPKEDPLHRQEWRPPYGAKWMRDWKRFAAESRQCGVEALPGLAPGLSYDYSSEKDYGILLSKFKAFRDAGSQTVALLMDDIPSVLPKMAEGRFTGLGQAHGLLLARLWKDLNGTTPGKGAQGGGVLRNPLSRAGKGKKTGDGISMWFCPTVYTDQFAKGPAAQDAYLVDLAATMPPEITILWTGPKIISESLPGSALKPIAKLFRGNVLIWDNFYANDYCPNKLFLGPYTGRTTGIWDLTRGVLLNPTGLPVTDMFLLTLLAGFRQGLTPKNAWLAALKSFDVPVGFLRIAEFLSSPYFQIKAKHLRPKALAAARKILHPLIWDWKGPLHQEWSPYLFMLDADMKAFLDGSEKPDAAWLRKRYSPLMAHALLERQSVLRPMK